MSIDPTSPNFDINSLPSLNLHQVNNGVLPPTITSAIPTLVPTEFTLTPSHFVYNKPTEQTAE